MSDKSYVIREIPGKGFGVIAFRDIVEGELIIAEKPLFVVPWWIRHSAYPKKELSKYIDRCLDELSDEEEDAFYDLSDCKCKDGEEKTELGIWKTNNFALGRSSTKSSNGIFPKLSRFNHSCIPSAEFRWNPQRQMQEIRAIRNIGAGDEITLCYFTLNVLVKSSAERRDYLLQSYGFLCSCPDCILEGQAGIENDRLRRAVVEMDEELDDLVYEWVDVSDDDEESSETMNSCRPSAKEDYQLALKIAIKRLNLMKKLGFKVISMLDACKKVVDLALDIEDYSTANEFSKHGLHLATVLFGPADTAELRKWEKLADKK